MSKLSKFIKTPNLYFKDAIKKHIIKKNHKINTLNIIQKPKSILKEETKSTQRYHLDIAKEKINLVIIDNISENSQTKKNIIKYQLRSILKYCKFASINYISKNIVSSSKTINTFKNYNDFYEKKVLSIYPKNEIFVFINLNFFFLKKLSPSNLIGHNGNLITYIKKNKTKTIKSDEKIDKIIEGASYSFTPMENFSINRASTLIYLASGVVTEKFYENNPFGFLSVIETLMSRSLTIESPIQYARLDYGYVEKFVWIQSVHGSNRCPMAITFDKKISNENHYSQFLESLFPHSVNHENEITAI